MVMDWMAETIDTHPIVRCAGTCRSLISPLMMHELFGCLVMVDLVEWLIDRTCSLLIYLQANDSLTVVLVLSVDCVCE